MAGNPLQLAGIMSGLSTDDIISKMMQVERMPLTLLQTQKDTEKQKSDAIRDLNTRVSALLSTIQNVNLRSTVNTKTVTTDTPSSSPTLLTATANADAALGSFVVGVKALATATTVTSGGATPQAIGKAVQANQPLASAGFAITPTTGTFSVNGAQITIDSSTVLSDGVDAVGANTIFAKIRDATAALGDPAKAVTVSWGVDANGRQNKLVLSATGAIQLGAGADTSNFLAAAGIAALPPSTTMTSARNIGGANTSVTLGSASANLDAAIAAGTGSFTINGVAISYDTTVDSLNNVITRINNSAANVTASYDGTTDRLTLTAKNTGSTLISLQDVSGNFLATMKLSANNETLGTNASYLLNGQQRYSNSNAVTDAVAGVTLNLKKADLATDVTLTVSQDTSGAVSAVNDFVKQYNSVMGFIRDKTAYDAVLKKGGLLMGDSTLMSIQSTLSTIVSGTGTGLSATVRSLADIGVTTGVVGSAVGQTNNLVVDSAKLTTQLQSNPNAVADLFGALTSNVSLRAGGTGSIASVNGVPSNRASGSYSIVSDGAGNLTATFTPSGGGAPATVTGTITAGGTNSTLIPGVVLTAKGTFAAGTDNIDATITSLGVGVRLADYVSGLTSATGVLSGRQDSESKRIDEMNKEMARIQDRLDQREQDLYAKFNALETALARYQSQSSAINAQLARLSSG